MYAIEVPPSFAAAHSDAVATGPYSDGLFCQLCGVCWPTGSPIWRSWAGVITYGLCRSTAILP